MKIEYFISQHPLFTYEEFSNYLISEGSCNTNTHRELLAYHIKRGHILRIRKGIYAAVPLAFQKSAYSFTVDPYLIAGRIAKDGVLVYRTALDFHGVSYSIHNKFFYCSKTLIKPFEFQGQQYHRVAFPQKLQTSRQEDFAVEKGERQGIDIKVTKLERTLVDVLHRPDLCGEWEEIWRSLEGIPTLDIELTIKYALLLANATTVAKVGYFLEMHETEFSVTQEQLKKLEKHIPKGKHYFDSRNISNGKYFPRWNLIIPLNIVNKTWEEPDAII